jgi:hypothetical protein
MMCESVASIEEKPPPNEAVSPIVATPSPVGPIKTALPSRSTWYPTGKIKQENSFPVPMPRHPFLVPSTPPAKASIDMPFDSYVRTWVPAVAKSSATSTVPDGRRQAELRHARDHGVASRMQATQASAESERQCFPFVGPEGDLLRRVCGQ